MQRESLRTRLVAQRAVIAQQLDMSTDNGYPRSATMRFLKRTTVPAVTMIGGAATLFGGVRLYRTITAVLTAIGALRASSRK
jgi:hypothetical protein